LRTVKSKLSLPRENCAATDAVSEEELRGIVECLSYPRHYEYNSAANRMARDWLVTRLNSLALETSLQGEFDNVVAESPARDGKPTILLSAHYDTVPTTPGADDNNSAIAVCLETARVLTSYSDASFRVAIFNREEDGLLGSYDYVSWLTKENRMDLAEVHNFEMVGYYSSEMGSQKKPKGVPLSLPDRGDFIGILSNSKSNRIAKQLQGAAEEVGSTTPLVSFRTYLGVEKAFIDFLRSDHAPFWKVGIPAVMWTDTSEFRNPNYHASTDTPDTLDYRAMADVTRIIVRHVLNFNTR